MEIRYIQKDDDRLAVSSIYEEGWKYAYRGIVPQDYLDSIPKGQWAPYLDKEGVYSLVMIEDGRLIGTSSFSKSRWETYSDWGEMISIYLLPQYMGKGYGRLLLNAVVAELQKLGFQDIFLWVLAENINARKFYEKCGFRSAGHYMDHEIGGKNLREISYCYIRG